MTADIAVILGGYLLGSIPFAYIITRLVSGKDIRREGEGNVGGRNVGYVVGVWAGVATSLLDAAKGAAACLLAQRFGTWSLTPYLTGWAVMLGHGFPVWTRFIGGKGLASAAGYLLPLYPFPVLAGLAAFGLVSFGLRRFNTGVACGVVTLLALVMLPANGPGWGEKALQIAFIASLFLFTGFKKLVDLQRERETRARSGLLERTNDRKQP